MTNKINKNTQIYISKTLIYPTKIKPHNQHHHINTQKPSQTNSKTSHSLNLTQIHKSNNLSKCHLLTKQFTQTSHINNSKSIKIKLKVLHFPWILTNLNGSKIKPCARLESNNYLSKKTISPLLKFEFLFYFVFFPNPL